MVEVRLFATFREGREKKVFFEASEITDVEVLLEKLCIPKEDVAICLINGFHSKFDAPIKDSDIIALFPPVGGG